MAKDQYQYFPLVKEDGKPMVLRKRLDLVLAHSFVPRALTAEETDQEWALLCDWQSDWQVQEEHDEVADCWAENFDLNCLVLLHGREKEDLKNWVKECKAEIRKLKVDIKTHSDLQKKTDRLERLVTDQKVQIDTCKVKVKDFHRLEKKCDKLERENTDYVKKIGQFKEDANAAVARLSESQAKVTALEVKQEPAGQVPSQSGNLVTMQPPQLHMPQMIQVGGNAMPPHQMMHMHMSPGSSAPSSSWTAQQQSLNQQMIQMQSNMQQMMQQQAGMAGMVPHSPYFYAKQ